MFNFKDMFKKEQWGLVKTFQVDVRLTTTSNRVHKEPDESGVIYMHLYESNKGKRKIENNTTLKADNNKMVDDYVKRTDVYNTQIYRWLNGRRDPAIPTYNQIPEEETAEALRGAILK